MSKYLKLIPKTLQDDFIENRVVPFIGAGFSRNADLMDDSTMPDWEGLGKAIASYIPDYNYVNAIDALSLFETEFSRTKLIESIAKELKINSIKPGLVHKALCNLNFDTICTTNFDFLIEQTLNESATPFSTIVSEERLPISIREKTKLIKLHGDFNHPERMVITENDYDCFLDKNKVLATYISNIFITKTLLLIGYSLDDYDIRTLWKIIGSRLGNLRIPAYVVLVGATPIDVSRFARRNIKVINLPGDKSNYDQILKEFFDEIKELIDRKSQSKIVLTNEKAYEEFQMPIDESRLCFISAPAKRISWLKEMLYPILLKNNITPITLDEVIMEGDLITRKVDLIINKCFMSIVDVSGNFASVKWVLDNLFIKKKEIILVGEEYIKESPFINLDVPYVTYSLAEDNEEFINYLDNYIGSKIKNLRYDENLKEHIRLLEKREYNAAVISVFRFLEITLSKRFGDMNGHLTVFKYLRMLYTEHIGYREILVRTRQYLSVRNRIVHMDCSINKKEATEIVLCVEEMCAAINDGIFYIK